jgi:hypothetical protein
MLSVADGKFMIDRNGMRERNRDGLSPKKASFSSYLISFDPNNRMVILFVW